jgi:hypothetical protein
MTGSFSKRTRVIRRLFWSCLLVLHLAAIPAAWAALAAGNDGWMTPAVRFGGLTLATALFALKLIDVCWLRTLPGWKSRVSCFIIVSLLHVNVVQRAREGQLAGPGAPLGVGLVLTVCLEAGQRCRSVLLRALRDARVLCRNGDDHDPSFEMAGQRRFTPVAFLLLRCGVSPRAPPVLN